MTTRRIVIGTAGHVDHGKTTLVHALTGVDTDRLAEEKRRGISIELGFAPWQLADDLEATVIDVPGHRRFMRAMIAGASGVQLGLLVIAANEGVMPQTREHARACIELGIRRFVVALTKCELVDAETLQLAEAEARELVDAVAVVACSAKTGVGLRALRDAVVAAARELGAGASGAARLWVDRVFTMPGAGTIVTGTLAAGAIAVGDELLVGEHRAVARGLRIHRQSVDRAEATTRLAINLTCATTDVARGDRVTSDLSLRPTTAIDAAFVGAELKTGSEVMLHLGTTHVTVRVGRALGMDGAQLVSLALSGARPIVGGDRFLLRGGALTARDGALLGGGTVLDARPPDRRLRGEARWALPRALFAGDARAALAALLAEVAPRPLERRSLRGRLPIALERVMADGVKDGTLVACGDGILLRAALAAVVERVRAMVLGQDALARGVPVATIRQLIGDDLAELAIAGACGDDIHIDGDVVIAVDHAARRDAALGDATKDVEAALAEAGGHGISDFRIAELAGKDRAKAVMALLTKDGRAIHAGDLWFAGAVVADLRARVVAHLQTSAQLTVADLKTMSGIPRKQAVLLLELFDRERLTRRVGEARVSFSTSRA